MRIIELSTLDERLDDYRRLTDVALRRLLEPERGLYIAESLTVLERALAAGHLPRSVLTERRWLEPLAAVLAEAPGEVPGEQEVPVYVLEPALMEQLTGYPVHRGTLAAMHRPAALPVESLLRDARRVVVLEDLVDHTNVGAIFRSAAALGADAVLLSPGCADPLYRRSIRVSMGTVFQVPWARLDAWPGQLALLREHGFTTLALALGEGSRSLDELQPGAADRIALVLGTEGDGLSRGVLAKVDARVRIPMAGGVDSLNVAAAAAVALWHLRA